MNRVETVFNVEAITKEHDQVEKMLYNIIALQERVAGIPKVMTAGACNVAPVRSSICEILPETVFNEIHKRVGMKADEKGMESALSLCYFIADNAPAIIEYQQRKKS